MNIFDKSDCIRQFDKIGLMNFMACDIVSYAAQKYGQDFFEYIDMTCGAVPEGPYEVVIDDSAPVQFLDLYSGIVIKKIVLACNKVLELGEGYKKVLDDYFFSRGTELGLPKPSNVSDAFDLIQSAVLSGCMEEQNCISLLVNNDKQIKWQSGKSEHLEYWFYISPFITGILNGTGISFSITDDRLLSLNADD